MTLASSRITRYAALAAAATLASGCATYSSGFHAVEVELQANNPEAALAALDLRGAGAKEQVLQFLDKGMLLRMKRDYAGSNESLETAKKLMEELYAASITEEAAAFIINDATRAYAGEEYEQVLVHLYKALNYLELSQLGEARVEALQVDVRLREITARFKESEYTEDAFARYLTGLIYEELGEWSDAMIAYRKAYEAYQGSTARFGVGVPLALRYDLLRLTKRQGLTDELRKYQQEFGIERFPTVRDLENQGELVFVLHNGLAPIKREHAATFPDLSTGLLVRIALPSYQSRPVPITVARVRAIAVAGLTNADADSQLVENIDAIAHTSLNNKMSGITARAIARAVLKKSAAMNSGRQNGDNPLAGLAVNIMATLTERADTRSWLTLPHSIQLARLPLPPGTYAVTVDLIDNHGGVLSTSEFPNVVIEKRRKVYLSQHWTAGTATNY